jgi:hypothetical protein|tara:strand:+ start:229 stop:549 length:321 start_codon:yes stop_codon:yes gene_type:complete
MNEEIKRKAHKFDLMMEIFEEIPDNSMARQIIGVLNRLDKDYSPTTVECKSHQLNISINSEYICVVIDGHSYRRPTTVNELMGISLGSQKGAIEKKRNEDERKSKS